MAGNPQVRPAAEWLGGQHEAPPRGQGPGCCYGDQQGHLVGFRHLQIPRAGMSEGHWTKSNFGVLLHCLSNCMTKNRKKKRKKCLSFVYFSLIIITEDHNKP